MLNEINEKHFQCETNKKIANQKISCFSLEEFMLLLVIIYRI